MHYIDDTTAYRREANAQCHDCPWTSDDILPKRPAIEHAHTTSHRVTLREIEETTFNARKDRRKGARGKRDPDRRR